MVSNKLEWGAGFLIRFFARSFDILAEKAIIIITGFLVMHLMGLNFKSTEGELAVALLIILLLPLSLILDTIIYSMANNTLGKALLGLKVTTTDGKPLSSAQYLKRNLLLWIHGFALGLPIIYLFAMLWQAIRIGKGKPASYDEPYGYRVYRMPLKLVGVILFILLSILTFFVFVVFSVNTIIDIAFSNKLQFSA